MKYQKILLAYNGSQEGKHALLESAGLELLRSTYCNTLLLPFVVLRSTLDRLFTNEGSDLGSLPRPVEWSFRQLLEIEARLVRRVSLPVGASVVALGRKRA